MVTDMSAADRGGNRVTIFWDPVDGQDAENTEDLAPAAHARRGATVWSRRGLLQTALGCSGWLLVVPAVWLTQGPPLGVSYLSQSIWLTALVFAALVSTTVILMACLKRAWGVALLSVTLAVAGIAVPTRRHSQGDYVDYQYQAHRVALAELAEEYRAGRLPEGDLTLPSELRALCPSGYAYTGPTGIFLQMWQNWRHESGTGLAYFVDPPTEQTMVNTADGDTGHPQREVGDGWWWVQ